MLLLLIVLIPWFLNVNGFIIWDVIMNLFTEIIMDLELLVELDVVKVTILHLNILYIEGRIVEVWLWKVYFRKSINCHLVWIKTRRGRKSSDTIHLGLKLLLAWINSSLRELVFILISVLIEILLLLLLLEIQFFEFLFSIYSIDIFLIIARSLK